MVSILPFPLASSFSIPPINLVRKENQVS